MKLVVINRRSDFSDQPLPDPGKKSYRRLDLSEYTALVKEAIDSDTFEGFFEVKQVAGTRRADQLPTEKGRFTRAAAPEGYVFRWRDSQKYDPTYSVRFRMYRRDEVKQATEARPAGRRSKPAPISQLPMAS